MESSRRNLFIDMVVMFILKKQNQLRSSPVPPSYPKQEWDNVKQGLEFTVVNYCRYSKKEESSLHSKNGKVNTTKNIVEPATL